MVPISVPNPVALFVSMVVEHIMMGGVAETCSLHGSQEAVKEEERYSLGKGENKQPQRISVSMARHSYLTLQL